MLKQRVITSLVLAAILLPLIFLLPDVGLKAVIVVVTAGASWEWSTLVGVRTFHHKVMWLLLTLGLVWAAHWAAFWVLATSVVWWFVVFGKLTAFGRIKPILAGKIELLAAFSLPALVPFAVGLMTIRSAPHGAWQILYVILLVFAADTGGYFAGKQWGTIRIAPLISPKKSLQGLAGSVVFASLIATLFAWALHLPRSDYLHWYTLVAIIVLFALVGDLYVSMIKRVVDVKDSGTLLPGHGGLLDRIDGYTAAVPLYALFTTLYGVHFIS